MYCMEQIKVISLVVETLMEHFRALLSETNESAKNNYRGLNIFFVLAVKCYQSGHVSVHEPISNVLFKALLSKSTTF